MIHTTMATTKKRGSKKTAAKKAADTRAANQRKQGLRGAAKDSATKAALARARDPEGIKRTLEAREGQRTKRLGAAGTAISPGAARALTAQAKERGFRSIDTALRPKGIKQVGTITTPSGRAKTYAKTGRSG